MQSNATGPGKTDDSGSDSWLKTATVSSKSAAMPRLPASEAASSTVPETRFKPAPAANGCSASTSASAGLVGIATSAASCGTVP